MLEICGVLPGNYIHIDKGWSYGVECYLSYYKSQVSKWSTGEINMTVHNIKNFVFRS